MSAELAAPGPPPPQPAARTRILRLFSRLNVGGPAIHVILVTAGLDQRGYQTRLVVGRESEREGNMLALASDKGVPCVQLPALGREIRLLADVRAFWAVYRMIREYRPHIVHTHTAKAGALGRMAARLAGAPVVVHTYHGHVLQGYFGAVKTLLFRGVEKALGQVSDVLVAVSESVKQDLVALGVAQARKIHVVPLGLDLEHLAGTLPRGGLRAASQASASAPLVGIVGRLAPIKDVPTFLEAARLVLRGIPDARFAVVGDGPDRQALEAAAHRMGLDGAVHFHGWRQDVAAVYGDLDVVVNCSRNEGTPVALIEAMAARRPVVATRVGGTPDLVEGGRGLLVPPGDTEALAAAIVAVLRSPEAARARAARAQEYVLSHHSVGRLLSDLDALYRGLLAPAGRVP